MPLRGPFAANVLAASFRQSLQKLKGRSEKSRQTNAEVKRSHLKDSKELKELFERNFSKDFKYEIIDCSLICICEICGKVISGMVKNEISFCSTCASQNIILE